MTSFRPLAWSVAMMILPLIASATHMLADPPTMQFTQVWYTHVPVHIDMRPGFPNVIHGDPFVFFTELRLTALHVSTGKYAYVRPISGFSSNVAVQGNDDYVVLTEVNPSTQVFNRSSGEPVWNSSVCNIPDSMTYLAGTSQVLYCKDYGPGMSTAGLNITNGAVVWVQSQIVNATFTPCGPKVGKIHMMVCGADLNNAFAMHINTGVVKWWVPLPSSNITVPRLAATETTFAVFLGTTWIIIDVATGTVKANITTDRPFVPFTQNFGLYCGTSEKHQGDPYTRYMCINELGKIMLDKTYENQPPYSPSGMLAAKDVLLIVTSNSTGQGVEAIEVGTNRILWALLFAPGEAAMFFPLTLASFFAVYGPTTVQLWHARTGEFLAQLSTPVWTVFMSDKAPGHIFTASSNSVTCYRLQ